MTAAVVEVRTTPRYEVPVTGCMLLQSDDKLHYHGRGESLTLSTAHDTLRNSVSIEKLVSICLI